jgi:hypothetical protein
MTRIALAIVLLAAATAARASNDPAPAGLAAGQKARLTPAGTGQGRFTGIVVEVQPDALLVRRKADAPPERVLLGGLSRLEVARGRRGHFPQGALIGFVPGFLLGAYAGQVLGCDDQGPDCTAADSAAAGGLMLGGLTGLAGGLVGLAIRTDKWARVPIPGSGQARLGAVVVPVRGGVAARLALSF